MDVSPTYQQRNAGFFGEHRQCGIRNQFCWEHFALMVSSPCEVRAEAAQEKQSAQNVGQAHGAAQLQNDDDDDGGVRVYVQKRISTESATCFATN